MNNFSNWQSWKKRNELSNLKYPGVYSLAYSKTDISDSPFDWIEDIKYFGMTNSKGGLRQRLRQFERTISGKSGHGGAERFLTAYKYSQLVRNLFVSVNVFVCDVNSNKVEDLLIMGKVAEYEYLCFAEYVKRYKCLPQFNDKIRSPKNKPTNRSIK